MSDIFWNRSDIF